MPEAPSAEDNADIKKRLMRMDIGRPYLSSLIESYENTAGLSEEMDDRISREIAFFLLHRRDAIDNGIMIRLIEAMVQHSIEPRPSFRSRAEILSHFINEEGSGDVANNPFWNSFRPLAVPDASSGAATTNEGETASVKYRLLDRPLYLQEVIKTLQADNPGIEKGVALGAIPGILAKTSQRTIRNYSGPLLELLTDQVDIKHADAQAIALGTLLVHSNGLAVGLLKALSETDSCLKQLLFIQAFNVLLDSNSCCENGVLDLLTEYLDRWLAPEAKFDQVVLRDIRTLSKRVQALKP